MTKAKRKRRKTVRCHQCGHPMRRKEEYEARQRMDSLECTHCYLDIWTWDSGDTLTDMFISYVREHPGFYLEYAREYEPKLMFPIPDDWKLRLLYPERFKAVA